jgi:hypothetical protein
VKNAAGRSGKWLDVSAARLPGWIASFAVRHGVPEAAGDDAAGGNAGEVISLTVALADDCVTFTAPDGAVARCHPPFPESMTLPSGEPDVVAEAIAAHAAAPRTVGVFLVRLGGYAAGVFDGYPPVLTAAKTGARLVHGRSAAGGWSQHRFAWRGEKQANEALAAAADAAVMIFGGGGTGARSGGKITATGADARAASRPRLDAVVLGGDKRAIAELRDDVRLAPYLALATERFLTVPDPKRAVLESAPRLYLAVRIWLTEP